jgi:hypothetical protein
VGICAGMVVRTKLRTQSFGAKLLPRTNQKEPKAVLRLVFLSCMFLVLRVRYASHCYSHSDSVWAPVIQSKIDSGCRNDLPRGTPAPHCATKPVPVGPPAPLPPAKCGSDFDCAGENGACAVATGTCTCNAGWKGSICTEMDFVPSSGRVAFEDPWWTWGGSPIEDDAGGWHLFASEISNGCGILHYTVNSQVLHLTASHPAGSVAGWCTKTLSCKHTNTYANRHAN